MLQSAFRRVLLQSGSGLPGQCAAAAATSCGAGSKLGAAEFSSNNGGSTHGRGASTQPDFHIPSLFSSRDSSDDAQKASAQPRGLPAALMGSMPLLSRSSSPLLQMPFAVRGYHALRQLQSPAVGAIAQRRSVPLGLGLGLTSLPLKPSAVQTRPYTSEGELLGAAYLLTTDIMFWSGLIGAVVFRRNIIVMLLCTEIVMLACNMNFLFASAYLNDMTGVIMSITITTIAACETAIGLALCVTYFHIRSATDVEALNLLK